MINGRLNMVSVRVVWLSLKPQSVMITHRYLLLVMNGLKILHQTEPLSICPSLICISGIYQGISKLNPSHHIIYSQQLRSSSQSWEDNVKNISHLMKPNKIFYKISLVTLSESIPKIVLRLQLVWTVWPRLVSLGTLPLSQSLPNPSNPGTRVIIIKYKMLY